MTMRPRHRLLAIAAAVALGALAGTLLDGRRQALCACGGPEFYDIDAPLAGPERWLDDVAVADAFEGRPRDELRFLAPFRAADSARTETLWTLAYSGWIDGDSLAAARGPSVAPLDAALRAGDLARAERAAQEIVGIVLDMPAPVADRHQAALRRAVELLELAPALRGVDPTVTARVLATDTNAAALPGPSSAPLPAPLAAAVEMRRTARASAESLLAARPGHPRAASLRWVALQERLRRDIPDGWPDDIREQVPTARWRSLDEAHTRWLADHPAHPLADLVRLSRVRVAYYEGDSVRAWRLALAPWPRHLPRLLGEARVLAVRGMVAPLPSPAADDPRLRSAMLTLRAPSAAEWDALWRLAEDSIARPWAPNLEERLLHQAALWANAGRPLPARFPSRPAVRTTLWGRLRMVALFAHGDLAGAEAQAAALGDDSTAALVRARIALARRQWTRAAREPLLGDDARAYLVRVLLPDSALVALLGDARASLSDSARAAAALTLAARAAAREGWTAAAWTDGAATIASAGGAGAPERATRWRRAAALAADGTTAGRLAYARWLAEQRGALFLGVDNAWYRSLGRRERTLREPPDTTEAARAGAPHAPVVLPVEAEVAAIRTHLATTTEPYLALRAYADWLARTEPQAAAMAAERRRVAREADRVYNLLVNWDATNTGFWRETLARSEAVRTLRRAGRE